MGGLGGCSPPGKKVYTFVYPARAKLRYSWGSGLNGFGWLPNWWFSGEVKALRLGEKIFTQGIGQGRNHWWHTQKHHTRIRTATKGNVEANIWTNVQRRFQNVG